MPCRRVAALCCAVCLAMLPAVSVAAAPVAVADNVPRVRMPLMTAPPTIDGTIADDEWQGAVRNAGFVALNSDQLSGRYGDFWLGCDGTTLYIAVKSETPPDGSVLTRAVPHPKNDVTAAFHDDCLELVLDPKRGRPSGSRTYYHIITNARGALYDRAVDPDNRQNPMDVGWRLQGLALKTHVHDGWWHVEMAIPLASLEVGLEDLQREWGVRVARNWRRPGQQSQWASKTGSYLAQPTMPVVRWDAAAPVVQVRSLHEAWKEACIRVAIRNPHAEPLKIHALVSDAWHHNPPQELERDIEIPAGATEILELKPPDGGEDGLHRTKIRVTDAEGATVYYSREHRWALQRPETLWSTEREEKKAVSLLLKFYPYHSKIRLRVDLEALAAKDKVTGANALIRTRPEDGAGGLPPAPLWQTPLRFDGHAAEGVHTIPDLPDGRYVLAVTLAGGAGVPTEEITEEFVRQRFEWEHNQLGISDEVMPPFTPLEVEGSTVRSVLREHAHADSGLWQQVTSQDRPLLAGPMSWEVVTGVPGQEPARPSVRGDGWSCLSRKATSVVGESGWSAGPVRARVRTEYDYDGMMLVKLTLMPTGQTQVQRLTLTVPVRESEARYMHAVGDSLRHNFAGFIPAGAGRVWDSGKANKVEIANTFFPYLWVGGGERGVCWFADNDRGWALDDDTPVIDLTREGETLRMRVHLITRPVVLTEEREIVFGLQATPTKPMPEGWRRWTGRSQVPGGRAVTWLGSTYYWGGIAHDVYPYEKNFEYWEEMRNTRRTGEINQDFLARWMKNIEKLHPKDGKGYEAHGYEFIRLHLNAGFRGAQGSPWTKGVRLFGYTNARGIGFQAPEFATFQDEWLRFGWFNRNWGERRGVSYDVSPSPSFVDFAVWYYRKMLTWTDGVYWDNTFLSAHYDPVVGGAWVDGKGTVHPGLGLFHLRELIKRTAVMHWQESREMPAGRKPLISLSHMTNTMIVPVLSFGNCNMDWEWKYGYSDFQDRFSPDLTVAETIGRQVGAWGTILAGGHPDPKDPRTPWMWRTRLGVCLVHELQCFDYRPKEEADFYAKLFAFGYGAPECSVLNYWDTPHPAKVTGVDARTLVCAHKDAALAIVTDYGEGGSAELALDLEALGLPAEVVATDFETGQAIEKVGSGRFRFQLKKHDFKAVRIAATGN